MPNALATCKHESCSQPASGGRGYCGRHFAAWKRGKLPKARYKSCRVEGCKKRVADRGRCAEHFARDYPGRKAAVVAEASAPEAPAGEAPAAEAPATEGPADSG